jgi:FtsX-like permease family
MLGLGFRLVVNSGKEALTRLLLTMLAVGVGAAILLAAFADFNAFQATNNRPAWDKTGQVPASQQGPQTALPTLQGKLLWNYSNDVFEGKTIKRLDLAVQSADAPVLPGIAKLPTAGQYYVSPALEALLRKTPGNMLGNRFPGKEVGTIGDQALTSPDELVIFIGHSPAELSALPTTVGVNTISSKPQTSVWTNYFRYAFAVGAVAILFPILILIGTATRLAAARREERFAALRLVGATPRQIGVLASVDAFVSAFLGVVLGIGIFSLIQPALASATITGARYFSSDVTPGVLGYLGALVLIPLASAVAALVSLRRVQISPLGVSRKTTPPAPKAWRALPLLIGLALFVFGVTQTTHKEIGSGVYFGLIVTMIGLVMGGPWLTMQAARLLARFAQGPSSLLAVRRIANDPKAAFRSVSGLVLAVFLSTALALLLPSINSSSTATPSAIALDNVLLTTFTSSGICGNEVNCTGDSRLVRTNDGAFGLAPQVAAQLLSGLRNIPGTTVIPLYTNPQLIDLANQQKVGPGEGPVKQMPGDSIISCEDLAKVSVLGQCPAGAKAVVALTDFESDNPSYSTQAIANQTSPAVSDNVSQLYLATVLIKVNNSNTLEKTRTYLATHTPQSIAGMAPRTFGEAVQIRTGLTNTVQRMFNGAVGLTLFVAGCSLAVTVGGGMVERKRPFSLLRLSGVPITTLYKVVLLEAVLPLVTATLIAAGIGYGISVLAIKKIAAAGAPLPTLGSSYFLLMGAGLVASLCVILVTLPLLGRLTKPDNVRFE